MSIRALHGDCLEKMRELAAEGVQVQSIVTDPPAGIAFMQKEWDRDRGGRDAWIAWMRERAAAALALVPPGGHALVWALPRTTHWTATAWEDAGWIVRDRVAHIFGTGFPKSHNLNGEWEGWGTALKPAVEDWWLMRKPLVGTVAQNVLVHGVGALNIDACRVGSDAVKIHGYTGNSFSQSYKAKGLTPELNEYKTVTGRWPANLVHSGCEEIEAAFAKFGESKSPTKVHSYSRGVTSETYTMPKGSNRFREGAEIEVAAYGDSGTASRFFYSAKASKEDRADSKHPTVKPIALMRWLVRLVTPPGGTVLDPFAGSGTTLAAAHAEGFNSIGIEKEDEYHADILRRVEKLEAAPQQGSMF